jgi:hypothetical protein
MPTSDTSSKIVQLELEVLRRILGSRKRVTTSPIHEGRVSRKTLALLRGYDCHDCEHQIVFEAIERLRGRNNSELREQLPAQATRMGFPDVNWENFFAREELSQVRDKPGSYDDIDIEMLVEKLCSGMP